MIFCQFILTSDSSELLVFFCYEIAIMFGIIVCGLSDWYGLAKVGGGYIKSSDGLIC